MSDNDRLSEDGEPGWGRPRQDTGERWLDDVRLLLTLRWMPITVWRFLFIVFFATGMSASSSGEPVDHRDFAIGTCYPKPNHLTR